MFLLLSFCDKINQKSFQKRYHKKPGKKTTVDIQNPPKMLQISLVFNQKWSKIVQKSSFWRCLFLACFLARCFRLFWSILGLKMTPQAKSTFTLFGPFFDFFPEKCAFQFCGRFLVSFGHKINQKCRQNGTKLIAHLLKKKSLGKPNH